VIVLLDLNFTLVTNSTQKRAPFARQIEGETYDLELIEMIRRDKVVLITARPEKYRIQTLQSIRDKTGWTPAHAFFNDAGMPPPQIKERHLPAVFKAVGTSDPARFLAIESNPMTRVMYARHSIKAMKAAEFKAKLLESRAGQ
jgi:hypothetical protein